MDTAAGQDYDRSDNGEPHGDVMRAFQAGLATMDQSGKALSIAVEHAGDLTLTTGYVVACDPFSLDDRPSAFTEQVPAGRHPVLLSVAHYDDGDQRVACALLRFSDSVAVRWNLATTAAQDRATLKPGETFGYSVDAGTGCFTDRTVIESLLADAGALDLETLPMFATEGDMHPSPDYVAKVNAVSDYFQEFNDQLLQELGQTNYLFANVTVDIADSANIIAFSSGWGDGRYASFFGYDMQGEPVCLVTDFQVL